MDFSLQHSRGRRGRGAILRLLCLGVVCFSLQAHAAEDVDTRGVIVLANRQVPESVELARHYMERRSIPAENLCVLDLPKGEQMSRKQFNHELREPLLQFLRDGGWIEQAQRPERDREYHETNWLTQRSEVTYLVSMYGVPLRIGDTRFRLVSRLADHLGKPEYKNMAAVDSELALLLAPPYAISGPKTNPMYRTLLSQRKFDDTYLIVAVRLDGPDAGAVKRMIDDALEAERYGLLGRMYFDARGLTQSGYFIGDFWIREAHERFARMGYETVIDFDESLWPESYPMEEVALYMGWYHEDVIGPFTRDDFQFRPGAIGYHIHSASAVSLRKPDRYWAGPLLARGAAVSMGAVSEPFLTYTPNLKIFAERLIYGHTFGNAAYMSQPVLSWQMTFIGDPLYRPFRYPLHVQLKHLQEDAREEIEWAYLREVNTMVRQGRFNPALQYLRQRISEQDSLILRERLADLYILNDLIPAAGREYGVILDRTESPVTAARVGAKWARILLQLDARDRAERLVASLVDRWDHPTMQHVKDVIEHVD